MFWESTGNSTKKIIDQSLLFWNTVFDCHNNNNNNNNYYKIILYGSLALVIKYSREASLSQDIVNIKFTLAYSTDIVKAAP